MTLRKTTIGPDHKGYRHPAHAAPPETGGPRLLFAIGLNFLIPVLQVVGGILANSMALISDAVHNFSDLTGLLISYAALRIGKRRASPQLTFGWQRAEILGAVANVGLLLGAVVFIVYEAIARLGNPEPVAGGIVMILAGAGIIGNGFSALLLHRDAAHNLNIRGAFLHMLGDFFVSLAVLVTGAVLLWKPWFWLDPLLCLFVAVFIVKNGWGILKQSAAILMNATPDGLDLEAVQRRLESRPEIDSAHHLHAWHSGNTGIAFTCHLTVKDQMVSETEILSEKLRHHLFHEFGIDHPVFQFETTTCGDGDLICALPSSTHPARASAGMEKKS